MDSAPSCYAKKTLSHARQLKAERLSARKSRSSTTRAGSNLLLGETKLMGKSPDV